MRNVKHILGIAVAALLAGGCDVQTSSETAITTGKGGGAEEHAAVHLSAGAFAKQVRENEGVALVDFWATWCGPCKKLAPTVEAVAVKYKDRVIVGKVDVDQEPGLADEFGIRGIPTLKVFKNGKVVEEMVGVVSQSKIEAALARHLE